MPQDRQTIKCNHEILSYVYPIGRTTHYTKDRYVPDRVHYGSCESSHTPWTT
ncbi:hypothetical protein J6590_091090, partial [Homalodisca vitripennis]